MRGSLSAGPTDNAVDFPRARGCNVRLAFPPDSLVPSASGPCLGSRMPRVQSFYVWLRWVSSHGSVWPLSQSEICESWSISVSEKVQGEAWAHFKCMLPAQLEEQAPWGLVEGPEGRAKTQGPVAGAVMTRRMSHGSLVMC